MGKKSAPKVQESANERALAEVSASKLARYESLYAPQHANHIREVSRDTSGVLGGRAIADVAQAERGLAGQAVQLGRGSARLAIGGDTGARGVAVTGANRDALALADKGKVDALKIGQGMATDAQNGLAVAARASQKEAMSRVQSKMDTQAATSRALGQVVGAGAITYDTYKSRQAKKTGDQWNGFLGVN